MTAVHKVIYFLNNDIINFRCTHHSHFDSLLSGDSGRRPQKFAEREAQGLIPIGCFKVLFHTPQPCELISIVQLFYRFNIELLSLGCSDPRLLQEVEALGVSEVSSTQSCSTIRLLKPFKLTRM